jgi:hypothetical protein
VLRREAERGPAIVVGDAPYKQRGAGELDSILDRLVRETSMVFFYDRMNTPEGRRDRQRDWGFRHCYGLNFSADLERVREVGGFLARAHVYGYDDIELAFRLCKTFDAPVLYRPEAIATHDHFYTSAGLMERERALGRAAWVFAGANPAFGEAVFGRDIRSRQEIDYSREFVRRERAAADRSRQTLSSLEHIPADSIGAGHAPALVRALYEQHLIAKRWEWRMGLLEAADGGGESIPPHGRLRASDGCKNHERHAQTV